MDFFTQIATNPFLQGVFIFLGILAPVIIFVVPYLKKKKKIENLQKPIVQVVNFGVEAVDPNNPNTVKYCPNLRNDGTVPVNRVRIYFKIEQRILDIREIVKKETDIKKRAIEYNGSILPNGSARVDPIDLQRTENESSVILWLEYNFADNKSDEIIFDVRFKNFQNTKVIPYTHENIIKTKEEIKISENGAPIG